MYKNLKIEYDPKLNRILLVIETRLVFNIPFALANELGDKLLKLAYRVKERKNTLLNPPMSETIKKYRENPNDSF